MHKKIDIHQGECWQQILVNTPSCQWHIVQQEGSTVRLFLVDIFGLNGYPSYTNAVHNEIVVEQQGEHCTTEIYAVSYLKGDEDVQLTTRVHHLKEKGSSKQLVKFVLDDEAKAEFYGELTIAPHAQQTTAEQTNRNLLLSTASMMRTRPQLEIYADDVKATHGASTGQLDDAALFYMRQRGISQTKARQLLIGAFLKDVLAYLKDDALSQSLMDAIDSELEKR